MPTLNMSLHKYGLKNRHNLLNAQRREIFVLLINYMWFLIHIYIHIYVINILYILVR